MYLIEAATDKYHYFINMLYNETYYANQVVLKTVPTSLPTGYSAPSNWPGYPTVSRTPYVEILNNNFGKFLGFTIGNYGINANSRYTQIKTQNIYLGTTAADSRTVLGNGSNSNTGDYQGTVNIQKLQVGNNIAGQGSGVGNGTPFRCVIIGRNVGSTSLAKGTITIPNAPTGAGFPMVFASINTNPDATINPYFINVYPSSNTEFP